MDDSCEQWPPEGGRHSERLPVYSVRDVPVRTPSGGPPPPGFFISVHFERVKVICFDTLLQVLILKTLHCTGTVRVRPAETPFRRMVFPGWESKNASREAGVTMLRRWYYDAQTRFYPWFTVHER